MLNRETQTEETGVDLTVSSLVLKVTVGPRSLPVQLSRRSTLRQSQSFRARVGRWIGAKVGLLSLARTTPRRGYAEFNAQRPDSWYQCGSA